MIERLRTRFDGLIDIEHIRKKVTVRPKPVGDIDRLPPMLAAHILDMSLRQIYLPNQFSLELIAELVGKAAVHSAIRSETEQTFVKGMYYPITAETFPICLTGLAGVGKSATIEALLRAMPGPTEFKLNHYMKPQTAESYWYASAKGKASGKQLLTDFLGIEATTRENTAILRLRAQQQAHQRGISLAILEEMQHLTPGKGAALTTDILLTMSGLGLPMVYVSNFSLGHKLLKRNQEDTQRLVAEPRIMWPDALESKIWAEFIDECITVSDGRIRANPKDFSYEIYRGSYGLKRAAIHLMVQAYIQARSSNRAWVEIEDVQRAYASSSYYSYRVDVEELERIAIQKNSKRDDLNCPFGSPIRSNVVQFVRKERDHRVAQAAFKGALTAEEREAHKSLKLDTDMKAQNPKRPKRPPLKKPTNDDLGNAFNDYFGDKEDN
ncbi:transposase [Pseudomonas sp. MPR-R2A7]|uniref:ATP-binding protein n=2 Tax=unclassified Pseudomonas TaxID=196821 RepID=UPI000C88061E|nr:MULTISPECIES: ATP-binding protein [unclassified Pseudomonas]PMX28915.1 transposase [Pseudomonas sp. GW460-12]PMX44024.1 transposase [Pseudomonas sp. MPR-R2A7]PMX55395.1 transposase [Pseudomonas sp. MPR-R2A6]PMX94130.1 transposase [Pseudomonas sp. MPR-R2A3]PMY16982.1 transposase [Pseudomonas sp. MPR-R2A5]PNA79386.1 transposase [Pseudomonas sp. MPR-LB3]